MFPVVSVLRYGHRIERDKRVTTHCCLVARALGAGEIILCGQEDTEIVRKVEKIGKKWGGSFKVLVEKDWKKALKQRKREGYAIVHLTMYGLPLNQEIKKMRKRPKILVVIGSQKVEGGVYKKADFNVSIGTQPHSEVAALAVFLDRLFNGKELGMHFKGSKLEIVPTNKGKKTIKKQ